MNLLYWLCMFIIFLAMILLSSCKSYNDTPLCPVYPVAGVDVANELETAGEMPNFYQWLGRIDKLRQELELCRGK